MKHKMPPISVCDWCIDGFYAAWPNRLCDEIGRVAAECDICGEKSFCTGIVELTEDKLTRQEAGVLGKNQSFKRA